MQGTIFGETDVLYDLDKFIYLGSHARYAPYAFVTRKAAGFNSRETLITARGVRIGAPSVGHSLYTMARLFAYMLDMKSRVGSLAIRRGRSTLLWKGTKSMPG